MTILIDNKKVLQFFVTDVTRKEVKKIDIIDEDKISILYENGDREDKDIYNFIIQDVFFWFYEQGYYITINYAPKIVSLYPKTVETHEFKEFSKGKDLIEATINLYKWLKKEKNGN